MTFSIRVALLAVVVAGSQGVAAAHEGVPALQVTAPDGAISLLVSDVHIAYPGLRQPLPSVVQGKARLVIESSTTQGPQPAKPDAQDILAPNALESFRANGTLARAPWAATLSNQDVATIRRIGQCLQPQVNDNGVDIVLALKSAAGAVALATARCAGPGQLSRDQIFAQAAARYAVPIDTLETQVEVEAQRKAVPERIYEEQLRSSLDPRSERFYIATVAAVNRGDYDAVLREADKVYLDPDDAATFYDLMVEERNRAWMPRLRHFLDQGNALVLVGAAHLGGKAGLIRLLKQAGYRIAPTMLPADITQG